MALTAIPVENIAVNSVDRSVVALALKTLRDEAEARLLALETGVTSTYHTPVADLAAMQAIAAADRADGMICVKLDDVTHWTFDAGSAAAASDWAIVPTAGTGRWLRTDELTGATHVAVADAAALQAVAAVSRANGMIAVKLDDDTIWTFDSTSTASASNWAIAPTAGTGMWLRRQASVTELVGTAGWYGAPMFNRLRLLGAPGAIVAGDTVEIGGDTYEFNAATPPAGGTAGSIWVYNGASSADSRANLIDAINGVVNAATVTRDAANTELVVAAAGVAVGDIVVFMADAIGGNVIPSATATVTTNTPSTATDIWDAGAMYGGRLDAPAQAAWQSITIDANHIAKGNVEFEFDFTPNHFLLFNRTRPIMDEGSAIVGNAVSLTLTGGASPNVQAADVISCFASQ